MRKSCEQHCCSTDTTHIGRVCGLRRQRTGVGGGLGRNSNNPHVLGGPRSKLKLKAVSPALCWAMSIRVYSGSIKHAFHDIKLGDISPNSLCEANHHGVKEGKILAPQTPQTPHSSDVSRRTSPAGICGYLRNFDFSDRC